VANNQLTESLPFSLTRLRTLASVSVSGSNMGGELPAFAGPQGALQLIFFNDNDFTGDLERMLSTIPTATFCGMTLRGTMVGGSIPSSIANFQQLQWFFVGNTYLTGTIPSQIGDLGSTLEVFDVSQTFMSGTVPTEVGRLSLTNLGLSNTRINGSFPGLVSLLSPPLPWLFVQNSKFTGKVQLLECVGLVITAVLGALGTNNVLMDRSSHGPTSFGKVSEMDPLFGGRFCFSLMTRETGCVV